MGGGKPAAGRGLRPILATPLLERASTATSTQFLSFWRTKSKHKPCRALIGLFDSRTRHATKRTDKRPILRHGAGIIV